MKEVKVKLDSIDAVKNFVTDTTQFSSHIDLISGRYTIDAKSILGIFSLDLNKPITMRIDSDEEAPKIIECLKEYIVS